MKVGKGAGNFQVVTVEKCSHQSWDTGSIRQHVTQPRVVYAGGASSTGGAVLKEFFTSEQLKELSAQIDPDQPSGLDYYPLTKPGERFPVNDPHLEPCLTPRPGRHCHENSSTHWLTCLLKICASSVLSLLSSFSLCLHNLRLCLQVTATAVSLTLHFAEPLSLCRQSCFN